MTLTAILAVLTVVGTLGGVVVGPMVTGKKDRDNRLMELRVEVYAQAVQQAESWEDDVDRMTNTDWAFYAPVKHGFSPEVRSTLNARMRLLADRGVREAWANVVEKSDNFDYVLQQDYPQGWDWSSNELPANETIVVELKAAIKNFMKEIEDFA